MLRGKNSGHLHATKLNGKLQREQWTSKWTIWLRFWFELIFPPPVIFYMKILDRSILPNFEIWNFPRLSNKLSAFPSPEAMYILQWYYTAKIDHDRGKSVLVPLYNANVAAAHPVPARDQSQLITTSTKTYLNIIIPQGGEVYRTRATCRKINTYNLYEKKTKRFSPTRKIFKEGDGHLSKICLIPFARVVWLNIHTSG